MYHKAFDWCQDLLLKVAKVMNPWWPGGMDYVKINVLLFCVVLPLVLAASLLLNLVLWLRLP